MQYSIKRRNWYIRMFNTKKKVGESNYFGHRWLLPKMPLHENGVGIAFVG